MHLKRQTEIAFGILAVCARQEGEIISVQKVAQEIGATKDHTYQVVALLARNGLLQSERGPGGGLKLARDPRSVKLAEVLRLVQPELLGRAQTYFHRLNRKQKHSSAASSRRPRLFARLLDRFTVADLIAPESNLRVSCLDCGLLASSQQATVSLTGDVRPEPLVAWRSGTRS